jgi:hypothetical protein
VVVDCEGMAGDLCPPICPGFVLREFFFSCLSRPVSPSNPSAFSLRSAPLPMAGGFTNGDLGVPCRSVAIPPRPGVTFWCSRRLVLGFEFFALPSASGVGGEQSVRMKSAHIATSHVSTLAAVI